MHAQGNIRRCPAACRWLLWNADACVPGLLRALAAPAAAGPAGDTSGDAAGDMADDAAGDTLDVSAASK
jgi:hypothetical protein